jgi:ribonuclease E
MTVVDVNTGKFTGSGGNLEQTVTKNNLEAAEEIVRQLRLRDIGGIVVIDFIDMVLESNRDLVLRRLTEALGRDRTRHQVSEVTSLGLVQLTRKRLGTGLVEAFSTTCPHCSGRGIMLHADPVDSAPATGRKSESGGGGGRRGRRSKKGKAEEPAVVKVPAHTAEHPMFKAMAAANGRHEDDTDESAHIDHEDEAVDDQGREDAESDEQLQKQVARDVVEEDLDDDDFEDSDDDADDEGDAEDEDTDQVDLDDDDDLDDLDDDEDDSDEDDDEDDDDEDDDEEDDEDEDSDEAPESYVAVVTVPDERPRRRRAAARPAGPPAHED